ncbi:hypothetical protein BUALT_Bualt06G0129800 [Buddleja alternifolia]|uniref:Protein kinase domain-containing protein n=1 Tax=Buddleja alternifolia TaxID=168488 RepID=A0AAV6XJ40_9LAMI|nr:hypothetical protein BUALT_Bualt06G0129800 [Buddleja alternifolia]
MSRIYDNWERLVAAVLRKQQLWELFHEQSRSPSICSEASSSSSSSFRDVDFAIPRSSSTYRQELEEAVAKSQKLLPKLVVISDFRSAFDVEEVFLASAELLGRGTFGSVYTAVMDNGVRFVVKRLNSVNISELEFKRHMDIVGNVRHENVTQLRAYYSSSDEKLMLYDYHSNGSMYALLHGQTGENLSHVDWETRLRVAIGAARGIAEMHSQNGGKLVHGNIKSSNIFFNAQSYGCVSDLGLTNIIETTFMPTARCYAPEVKSTENVSQESDVYSFGILLLELLTRKSPIHVPSGPDAVNLVKLVNSIQSKVRTSRVFDADLLKLPTIREQMVKVLQIVISCIAKSTKKRPKISEVVNMLENLGRMNTRNSVSFTGKFVFVDDGSSKFEFEDLLHASADVLGKGTFGTSYKLELDTLVVVKRLKGVNVTFEDFQQHMEVIGRMRHDNVAELKAYYFSKDEVLLVYDYLNQESVSALLHGKIDTKKTMLYWETRLQIAIGAARGIAHIHRQDNRKLKHGNIKSSNIFLNEQRYGIISDAGVANVSRPIRRSAMPTPGYLALELEDTKKVSQASDVFSFGVVLLELLTGKPSQHTAKDGEVISLVEWVKSVLANHWLVFDIELLRYQNDHEAIERVLQIAMDCVNFVPENRPKINEVVKMLEEISGIDTWGPPYIESRLENLLEDLLPTLTL